MLFLLSISLLVLLLAAFALSAFYRYRHDIAPKGKCIVVSGAASGIGEALVRKLLSHQCRVIAVDCNEHLLAQRQQEYMDKGLLSSKDDETYRYFTFDLSTTTVQDIQKRLFIDSEQSVRRIDALVNCAGISYPRDGLYTSLIEQQEDVFEKMLATNVVGHLKMTKAVFPHLLSRLNGYDDGQSVIMNVASPAGVLIPPYLGTPYGVTKAALISWNDGIRRELHSTGIDVCCVYPGFTKTGMAFKGNIDSSSKFSHEIENCQKAFGKIMDKFGQDAEEVACVMFTNLFSSNRGKHVYIDSNGKSFIWPLLAAVQCLCPGVIDFLLLKLASFK
ncbi:hypothetical protein C9374_002906 [Naegleria lovaniensis]|uniref:Short-chain dehydrogenase/reductase n=1 Tax=Naegleria lovaniensis TaxID=51637 RepID=A0AA88GRL8_NAELO|nr:uncharacterized protein C9374_002906 [Naegleria lovaniensis]KAG2385757.1 hypothetical protein C9374_002906 [Naegleria lovaniensis]